MIRSYFSLVALCITSLCFAQKKKADLLVYNAKVYTVDKHFNTASAIAIKNGMIEEVGETNSLRKKYTSTEAFDAEGKFIFPGFIDAHAHFYGYGLGLQTANLVGANSWEEVLQRVGDFFKTVPKGEWIIGRGWDQNDWPVKEFPTKEALDQRYPDNPVILTRIDGHAAIANQKALNLAGITINTSIEGGKLESKDGHLTGVLVDNAVHLVTSSLPAPSVRHIKEALLDAQRNCFAVGLTTIDDCGLNYPTVLIIDSLQKTRLLKMRIYAMLSDAAPNYNFLFKNGPIKTAYLNVRSFKVYADGALGSRGASLLQPYSDKPGWSGFLLNSRQHFDSVANILAQKNFQMCTHAIGDSGNRTILNIYAKYLKGKNEKRWRIEHAQVVDEADFHLFGDYSILPSVQPTHATSDMYWAADRLGPIRVKGAYAYKKLLEQNGWIPLGTDFPVEDISPFKTFYAAVFRVDTKDFPQGGYQMENALSREQALRGMTIWAAKANFEEKEKGSLEKGKFADFVILDKDLMTIQAHDVLNTSVLATYIGGEKVYSKN